MGKSRPLARPVTQPELLKTELLSILKQIGSLLCISSPLFFTPNMLISEVFNLLLCPIVNADPKKSQITPELTERRNT